MAVPAEWQRLAPFPLREMQARALAVMARGGDLVVNAATGSGKGTLLALPAAAAWHSAEPGVLAPIDMVIVPYKALGIHLEKVFNTLFMQLAKAGMLRPGARALFVRRSQRADSAEEPEAEAEAKTEPQREEAAVVGIPCGRCDMCEHPDRFGTVTRQRCGGCIFSCRAAMPEGGRDNWCEGCWRDRRQPPQAVSRCTLRGDLLRFAAAGAAGTPQTSGLSRTRSESNDAMADDGGGGTAAAASETGGAAAAAAAAAARRAEVRAQQFREQYAVGVSGLRACRELIRQQLDDTLPLTALQTTDAQRSLVLAAAGGGAGAPLDASPARVTTPTIGSVGPPLGRARNLFGFAPEPPAEVAPSAPSPRASLMGRVAAAMPAIRKRSGGSPSALAAASPSPPVDLSASPAAHVHVTDRGSPIGRGGVASASRQRVKRRGVVS